MPWSTWTTRSPTFEIAEVGEERPRRGSPALVRLALFLEDVGLGPELQAGVRQPEPARQVADADEHGRGVATSSARSIGAAKIS